jgi:hypothetical protein
MAFIKARFVSIRSPIYSWLWIRIQEVNCYKISAKFFIYGENK